MQEKMNRTEKEKRFWDKFARKYDPFMKHLKPTYDLLIQRIGGYLDKTKAVLEVATGTGAIALEIAPFVNTVHGCDLSPEMIKVANHKLAQQQIPNLAFSVQDAYHLDFAAGSFDVVIAANVLHIMINPEAALASMQKVLKPNGILIAPTYCHGETFRSRMISAIMSLAGFKAYHKWTVAGFSSFLTNNGFTLDSLEIIPDKIPLAFAVCRKH